MERFNDKLKEEIDRYIDILSDIINKYEINDEVYQKCKLNNYCKNAIKEEIKLKNSEIESEIRSVYKKISNCRCLVIALFVMRGVCKLKMYEDKELLEKWTLNFRIVNYMFFCILNTKNKFEQTIEIIEEKEKLIECFTLIVCYIENMEKYNKIINDINDDNYNRYINKINQVSSVNGDMNSYEIFCNDIKEELKERKLDIDKIVEEKIRKIRKNYYNKPLRKSDPKLLNIMSKDNLSNNEDDLIIIKKTKFAFYDKRFKKFIKIFSPRGNENLDTIEDELVFAYCDDDYVYISKKMMETTQEIINFSLKSEQYGNLLKYYFNVNEDITNKNKYNTIMTYKIADLLYRNKYIVPLNKKTLKCNKIVYVPSIEIKKYPGYKNEYGDIDIIFISPYTNKLYNLEYKNYQMMITDINDLTRDIQKVKKDNVITKTLRREEILKKNLKDVIKLFSGNVEQIIDVKSIILTTKPNYYLELYTSEEFKYYEWIEFKSKIENHLL